MVPLDAPTLDEAIAAVYIDFEGRPTHAPALIGVTFPDRGDIRTLQILVSPWAQTESGQRMVNLLPEHERVPVIDLETTMEIVAAIAESGNRRILSYSQHEIRMIQDFVTPDLADRVTRLFRDGKKALKRWWYARHSSEAPAEKHRLQEYLRLLGCHEYLSGDSKFVGSVMSEFEDWVTSETNELPDNFAERWLAALTKNRFDCEGLRCAVITALRDLAPD